MNIIADIAGRYDELMLLLDKMPKNEDIILLGDLNDRGPDSDKVIQWAIDNNIRCVKSNHGQMLLNAYKYPEEGRIFEINGGDRTLISYGGYNSIPKSHLNYLENCPWYIETEDLILTHAPIHPNINYKKDELNDDFLWNRTIPSKKNKFQIHGHNAYFEEYADKKGIYGLCLDNSAENELRGIHWPSKEIFTQEYL